MEQHSNSAHEGTNNANRHMGDPVKRTDSLAAATEKLASYDRARFQDLSLKVTRQCHQYKQFTHYFRHITTHVVGILHMQLRLSKTYLSVMDHDCSNYLAFYVVHDDSGFQTKYNQNQHSNTVHSNALNAVSNKNVTKKDMKCLRTNDVTESMSKEEKAIVLSGDSGMLPHKKHLEIASFLKVRRVTCQVVGKEMYLFCDCYMDDRCGTICRHKFHVYDMYLSKLGLDPLDYRSVHCINWSIYSFLANRSYDDMDDSMKHEWKKFQKEVENGFTGTLCTSSTHQLNITSLVTKGSELFIDNTLQFKGHDISYWYKAPAEQRVTNFSKEYVEDCIKKFGGKFFDSINMMSQVSHVGFDVEDDEEHAVEFCNGLKEFESIVAMNHPEALSASEREAAFMKMMYDMKNSINFNDVDLYQTLIGSLTKVQEELSYQQIEKNMNGRCEKDVIEFPNRTFGRNTKARRE